VPLLDETAPTISNFFVTKDEDMFLKHAGIKWLKASIWGNTLISLPITDKDHLEAFRIQPMVSNQFILVSYIGASVEDTANMEHHVQLLTPLVVTPLPSNMKPTQATDIIWNTGDCLQNGPVTNEKKLPPPKSFYDRDWFAPKRNQILCNCFLDNPTARITPVVPTNFVDHMAVIYTSMALALLTWKSSKALSKFMQANCPPQQWWHNFSTWSLKQTNKNGY
jgi:hypothetical protein